MDDSVNACYEIIDVEGKSNDKETKTVPATFNEKNLTCKARNFYTLHTFLLITIALWITVSIYCYLIKYRVKLKHLLPFHNTNNKLKELMY